MKSILFTNAKLKGQNGLQDIYITDGKFKEIGPGLAAKVTAEKVVILKANSPYRLMSIPTFILITFSLHLIRRQPTKPVLYLKASSAGLKLKAG